MVFQYGNCRSPVLSYIKPEFLTQADCAIPAEYRVFHLEIQILCLGGGGRENLKYIRNSSMKSVPGDQTNYLVSN